jgi:uncharacterized protein involved in exopolysaccharide biosynthesis
MKMPTKLSASAGHFSHADNATARGEAHGVSAIRAGAVTSTRGLTMAQPEQGNAQIRNRSVLEDGTIDLSLVAQIIRAEAFTFVTVLIICIGLSVLYLHVAKTRYAVRMEITSSSVSDRSKSGGLNALSSIAGISLGGEGSPQFRIFLGSLQSPVAAQAIASDQDLMLAVFYREWSQSDLTWHEPRNIFRPVLHVLGNVFGWKFAKWTPPGVSRVYDYLNDQLKVIPDNKSGVVTLEIDSDRPQVAERILLRLNDAMNERLRQHDLEHSTTFIDYLSKRLSEVNVVEFRSALVTNIAEQEKTRMQASSPLPYASDVLGTPMISTNPVSPKPIAAWAAGIIFGGLFGFWFASRKYHRR